MRVLYVSHSAGLSGAEGALLRLVRSLDRKRFEPSVLLPGEGPLLERLRELGVGTRIEPMRWWIPATHWSAEEFHEQIEGLAGRCDAVTAAVRSLSPDLVHTNTVVTLEGAVAAAHLGLPHVWHSRGLFGTGFPPAYLDDVPFFGKYIALLTDVVVAVSRAVERQVSRSSPGVRVILAPDGVDGGPVSAGRIESRGELFTRLGIDPSCRLIIAIGGIQRRKGLDDLILAAADLLPRFPRLAVALAGHETDPDHAPSLRDLVSRRGMEKSVHFIGFQEDVRPLLAHAELLVHPSRSEGFALVVLEALAAGTPVVATRSGGPEEILGEGSGMIVEPGDPPGLAAAIRRLLEDAELRARLRERGPKRALLFTASAGARRMEGLYDALLGQSAERPARRAAAAEEACAAILDRARAAARVTAP